VEEDVMLWVPMKQFERAPFPFLLKANITTNNSNLEKN